MTCYEDLTPYAYTNPDILAPLPVLNVGWLGRDAHFNKGQTSEAFRLQLLKFCRDEYVVNLARGFHVCELCDPSGKGWPGMIPDLGPAWEFLGNGEIRVLGDRVVYAAPTMILHYVNDHDYLPPSEFVDAVLQGDPDASKHVGLRIAVQGSPTSALYQIKQQHPPVTAIQTIAPGQEEAAREVMDAVLRELWGMTLDEKRRYDALYDMYDIQGAYLDAGGTFLVVLAADRVVGTGALRRIDETTCEIRRLWLLRDYRSKGWGRKLSQQLINDATARGYHTIRLLVEMPHQQKPAVTLYRSLGFDPVTWLNDPPGAVIMEKQLQPLFQEDR